MPSSCLAAFQGQLNCDGAGLKTYGEHQPVHFGQKFLPRKKVPRYVANPRYLGADELNFRWHCAFQSMV
ncbi:hypothetical protein QE372_003833 [Agrobacterium pusense]|nr:hypothetical protein [Agrobacterium pusense]